jgi:outer membrane protein
MLSIRTLSAGTLALAMATAFAPAAHAQDASGNTASGKRFTVTGGYSLSDPTRNPVIDGNLTKADGEGTPTLSAAWNITDNISVEAWGADRAGYRISTAGGKTASIDAQPYSLSGQYHFGAADNMVRPFVGLGYHETNYSHEKADGAGALAGQRIGVETAKGAVATVGVDVNINPTWFARADARYFDGDGDIKLDGAKAGTTEFNPVMVGVGIGARF